MTMSFHAASVTTSHGMYFWQRSRNALGSSCGATPRQAASSLRLPATLVTTFMPFMPSVPGSLLPSRPGFSKMMIGLLPARSSSYAIAVMSKRVSTGSRMRRISSGKSVSTM